MYLVVVVGLLLLVSVYFKMTNGRSGCPGGLSGVGFPLPFMRLFVHGLEGHLLQGPA